MKDAGTNTATSASTASHLVSVVKYDLSIVCIDVTMRNYMYMDVPTLLASYNIYTSSMSGLLCYVWKKTRAIFGHDSYCTQNYYMPFTCTTNFVF